MPLQPFTIPYFTISIRKDQQVYPDDEQYQEHLKHVRDFVFQFENMPNDYSQREAHRNKIIELMMMRENFFEADYLGNLKMFYEIANDEISRVI
jgi:hypothetical protein